MPMDHPPSVFVSSTCYDLAQVRKELGLFIGGLGMIPVLSDSPSFPVDPDLDSIENCLARVREKADIFVLIVGGRYGSETENGKSVTNLEYMWAKAKGIPRYVFVQKNILTAHSDWKKNRSGDFLGIVDSPKLFEFVELLHNQTAKNWVFPFDSAQDIIEVLHKQLAYLFMDALIVRTQVRRSGLPEILWQNLSAPALRLIVEKPYAWEARLFSQVLSNEISRVASIKKDLNYGLALGKAVRLGDRPEMIEWIKKKSGEFLLFVDSGDILINTAFPKVVFDGGDVEEIIYVAKRFAEVYRYILEWTIEFRYIQVEDEFKRLLELIARMSHNAIEEIEAFSADLNQKLESAVQQYEKTKQPQSVNFKIILTLPDMTELNNELQRLRKKLS